MKLSYRDWDHGTRLASRHLGQVQTRFHFFFPVVFYVWLSLGMHSLSISRLFSNSRLYGLVSWLVYLQFYHAQYLFFVHW